LGAKPVKAIPRQAMKGVKGRNHPMGFLSDRYPKAGWIIEEIRLAERRMTPDKV
jgi:hypothetical protein